MESIRPGFLRGLTWGSLRFEWSKAKLSGRRRPRKKVVPQLAGNGSQCQQVDDKECKFEKIRDFAWKKNLFEILFWIFLDKKSRSLQEIFDLWWRPPFHPQSMWDVVSSTSITWGVALIFLPKKMRWIQNGEPSSWRKQEYFFAALIIRW